MIKAIHPVSFGSTYKVSTNSNKEQLRAFDKFSNKCIELERKHKGISEYTDNYDNFQGQEFKASRILVADDDADNEIELFCIRNGIKYKKYKSSDFMIPSVLKRIEQPKRKMSKVNISSKRLEKLLSAQAGNISLCENDYKGKYKKNVNYMLKSAVPFPTTTLFIKDNYGDIEKTLRYINRYGSDKLDCGHLSFNFNRQTDNPDHCVYFGLKDMGITEIPVYVDDDTFDIAKALEIISFN